MVPYLKGIHLIIDGWREAEMRKDLRGRRHPDPMGMHV